MPRFIFSPRAFIRDGSGYAFHISRLARGPRCWPAIGSSLLSHRPRAIGRRRHFHTGPATPGAPTLARLRRLRYHFYIYQQRHALLMVLKCFFYRRELLRSSTLTGLPSHVGGPRAGDTPCAPARGARIYEAAAPAGAAMMVAGLCSLYDFCIS